MLTIDTSVLIRFLVDVDPDQGAVAKKLAEENTLFVLASVILEAEWVLRSVLGADAKSINALFRVLLDTDGIVMERPENLRRILNFHAAGMEFADAMHLCLSDDATTFVTFDRDLVRRARKLMPDASVELADRL